MKLTKKDKAILLKAAGRIFTGRNLHSCCAITDVGLEGCFQLRREYREFYEKGDGYWWEIENEADEDAQDWRILLLLWFREVGPEGIEL